MSISSVLPLLIVLSALVPGLLIFCVKEQRPKLRRVLNLSGNIVCLLLIALLIKGVYGGEVFEARLPLLPDIDLVLHADALSLLFVTLSGLLWFLTTIYAIGYLQGTENRSRFFGFFSLCVAATLGIALAGNLITFLIFYELLTLTTYPLVVHKGNAASLRAGRIYLSYTLFGGALLLAGVVWLKAIAGPLDFTATGVLSAMPDLDTDHLKIIFALLIGGLGVKAALVPFHGWLPVAMAAPAPVSALLHAVAVVKAGAFGIIRVVYDVYGIEFARDLGLTLFLAGIAAITIVYGSVLAVRQNDIKKRLAYSTVSQVSYIALGTAIAGPIATIGGMVHLVHQGVMKITLFFCAGNLAETLGIHKINEMNGVGRRMPLTMSAFTIASLGMIGIPPVAGFVSKWYLGTGALEVNAHWVLIILAISSLLNAIYFLPLLYATWFKTPDPNWPERKEHLEAPWMLLLPPVATASLALAVGLFAKISLSPLGWVELIAAREYGREIINVVESVNFALPLLSWVIICPLLLALGLLVPAIRHLCVRLAPLAAVPALLAAVIIESEISTIQWLFLGSTLVIDEHSQVMLLLASVLWFIVGIYGNDYLARDKHQSRYTLFFLLCMSGSFGLTLSQDLFGFITFFTLMSFSAYGLVVHTGTKDAIRAGRTYMQWVIIGEILLFVALAGLAISGDGNTLTNIDKSKQPQWVSWLLLFGFGVKAGLLATHFWLPRAHPVAPVPASALLSGLMVKAGLLGWWRFLPLGEIALPELGYTLIALGFSGAFLAVFAGITQHNPKALLAYSTISQMGILAAGVGVGVLEPQLWPTLSAALVLYALHHGLAKASLFLGVGLTPLLSPDSPKRGLIWLLILTPAVALTGLPLSSGALAKSALKQSVSELHVFITLMSLTAIGTTLLMFRFIDQIQQQTRQTSDYRASTHVGAMRILAYGMLTALVIAMVYVIPQAKQFIPYTFTGQSLWNLSWPVIAGAVVYLAGRAHMKWVNPIPAGDFIVVTELITKKICCIARRHYDQVSISAAQTVERYKPLWGKDITDPNRLLSNPSKNRLLDINIHPGILFIGVLISLGLALAANELI